SELFSRVSGVECFGHCSAKRPRQTESQTWEFAARLAVSRRPHAAARLRDASHALAVLVAASRPPHASRQGLAPSPRSLAGAHGGCVGLTSSRSGSTWSRARSACPRTWP